MSEIIDVRGLPFNVAMRNVMLDLPYEDIKAMCVTNKNVQKICKDESFWIDKYAKTYNKKMPKPRQIFELAHNDIRTFTMRELKNKIDERFQEGISKINRISSFNILGQTLIKQGSRYISTDMEIELELNTDDEFDDYPLRIYVDIKNKNIDCNSNRESIIRSITSKLKEYNLNCNFLYFNIHIYQLGEFISEDDLLNI